MGTNYQNKVEEVAKKLREEYDLGAEGSQRLAYSGVLLHELEPNVGLRNVKRVFQGRQAKIVEGLIRILGS